MDTRRKLAELDPDDDDPSPFEPAPVLSANKLARFTGALPHTTRKSKFERERELEQERARQQEDEAAKAYSEFVEAFGDGDGDEPNGGSTRRGRDGGARPSARASGPARGFVRAGGDEKYVPTPGPSRPTPAAAPPPPPSATKSVLAGARGPTSGLKRPTAMSFMDDDEPAPKPAGGASSGSAAGFMGKKKREGDNFLEQLKRDQAAREERLRQKAGFVGTSVTALAARENAPTLTGNGYYDQDDPLTTNVHVGGLPAHATEDALGRLFAQYGGVGSVKIMWPRLDSGQLNTSAAVGGPGRKLGGFVAFLRRGDAEKAVKEMDGAEWGDCVLRCGWGKAVPIAQRALYEPERGSHASSSSTRDHHHRSSRRRRSSRSRSRSRSPTDPDEFLRSKRSRRSPESRSRSRSRSRSPPRGGSRRDDADRDRDRDWPTLEPGVDEKFLRTVANKILDHGRGFEQVLREREKRNDKFRFLREKTLPSYHYFEMLLDRKYVAPMSLFTAFDDAGPNDVYSSDSGEDSEQERVGKGRLGRRARLRFEALLRGLTSTRERIARGMQFAVEHADAAPFIADLLVASLTIDSTPVPRKLARLHLVSDILHNASAAVPNAWTYRKEFEPRLGSVFDHLGDVYHSFPGRMRAEQFRALVERVVDVWDREWLVFEPAVIVDWKRRLAGVDSVVPGNGDGDNGGDGDEVAIKSEEVAVETEAVADSNVEHELQREGRAGGFKMSFKAATFEPAAADVSTVKAESAAEDLVAVKAEPGGEEDEDGEEIDLDGAAVEDDVDGDAVVEDDDDVDGAPVGGDDSEMF
ncbi:hypothetical protein JCM11491_003458 [Sporobolomyces phaffii]